MKTRQSFKIVIKDHSNFHAAQNQMILKNGINLKMIIAIETDEKHFVTEKVEEWGLLKDNAQSRLLPINRVIDEILEEFLFALLELKL